MAADMFPTMHSSSRFKSIHHLKSIVRMVLIWCFWMGSMDSLIIPCYFITTKVVKFFIAWSIRLTSYSHYYDNRTLWLINWTALISTHNMCASYVAFIWPEIPTSQHSSSHHNDLSPNQKCKFILCVCFGEDMTPFKRPSNGPVIIYRYHTRGVSFVPQYVKKYHLTDDQPQFITQKQHIFLPKSTCNNQLSEVPITTKE